MPPRRRRNHNESYVRGPTRGQLKQLQQNNNPTASQSLPSRKKKKVEEQQEKNDEKILENKESTRTFFSDRDGAYVTEQIPEANIGEVPFMCSNGKSVSASHATTDKLICETCKTKIEKDSFIIGLNTTKTLGNHFGEGIRWSKTIPWTKWSHHTCFRLIKTMGREIRGAQDFLGYSALSCEENFFLLSLLPLQPIFIQNLQKHLIPFFTDKNMICIIVGFLYLGAETIEFEDEIKLNPSKLRTTELKRELRDRGLETSGKKSELVERLEKALGINTKIEKKQEQKEKKKKEKEREKKEKKGSAKNKKHAKKRKR